MAPAAEQCISLEIGELPVLAIHDGSAELRYPSNGGADAHGRLMLQALELDNKLCTGGGSARCLASGFGFTLRQHDNYGAGDGFTTLWVEHAARNNFTPSVGEALARLLGKEMKVTQVISEERL